jgi:catechol 2,3-dioxygenase-like lactoylglutathione lyase family enzyme
MGVTGFDHVSLPTADAGRLVDFYAALGFRVDGAREWRNGTKLVVSLVFESTKLHLHTETMLEHRGEPWFLRAPAAEPGCGDLCLVWEGGIDTLLDLLAEQSIPVLEGPVPRVGGRDFGTSTGVSVYVRDPDENLLEFISYDPTDLAHYGSPRS